MGYFRVDYFMSEIHQIQTPALLNRFALPTLTPISVGISLAVFSGVLFAIIYLYSSWLSSLSGTQVFLWRMVAMWFGLLMLMIMTQGVAKFREYIVGLNLRQWLLLLSTTPIVASQFWLFMWAPVNGQAVNVAIGYFLFPLMMVLVGCIFFKEKLNRLQWIAVALAGAGVLIQFFLLGSVSWATAWVCLTYPIYYGLRRWQGVPALSGLFIDLSIIAPIALLYLIFQDNSLSMVMTSSSLLILIVGLGLISALAMQTNLHASRLLPMNMFGMLSYLEPALMFVLSILVLNEMINAEMMLSFGLIWVGILLSIINSMLEKSKKTTQ